MIVKLLTERHLEFLSLKGGCTGSSESTLVKMSNCWKSHALAQMINSQKWDTGARKMPIEYMFCFINREQCKYIISSCKKCGLFSSVSKKIISNNTTPIFPYFSRSGWGISTPHI